jgi:hypothetical protein
MMFPISDNDSASLACLSNSPGQALRHELAGEHHRGYYLKINNMDLL